MGYIPQIIEKYLPAGVDFHLGKGLLLLALVHRG